MPISVETTNLFPACPDRIKRTGRSSSHFLSKQLTGLFHTLFSLFPAWCIAPWMEKGTFSLLHRSLWWQKASIDSPQNRRPLLSPRGTGNQPKSFLLRNTCSAFPFLSSLKSPEERAPHSGTARLGLTQTTKIGISGGAGQHDPLSFSRGSTVPPGLGAVGSMRESLPEPLNP